MQLQTFKAPTMADCLTQVKTAMGADAIILHTRTYQTKLWMGLRRQEVVEITAGKGMNIGRRARPGPQADARDREGNGKDARGIEGRANPTVAGTYSRSGAARSAAADGNGRSTTATGGGGAAVAEPPGRGREPRNFMDTPAAASAAMLGLTQEVTTLKQMMKELIVVSRQRQAPNVPEELLEYYDLLVRNQVCEELATELVRTLQRQVRAEFYGQPQYMRERLAEQIEKMIPLAGPIAKGPKKGGGPHIVALVGPTGVGKTTTIAKLAANLKLKDRHKVGLITLDTYRIAAVDQLRRYAEIIGAPLKVVGSADELREAIRSMADLEYVLIDTAGRSPNDRLKLGELKKVLEAAEPDEVHLVLATTVSQPNVELAVTQFGEVRVDRVIFTKLDEAAQLGVLLNVVRKTNKALSYVTTGQDVPDDIEVGQGRRLAQLVMGEGI